MDVGSIGQSALGQLLGSLPNQSGQTSTTGSTQTSFSTESFSLDLSIQISATGSGATDGQVSSVQDLMDKLQQWVHDLFKQNGVDAATPTPDQAQQQAADGGDQSPDAVSKRILDFVKGLYDGTPGRAQLLRNAVEQGFHEAEGDFGGKLPDISYKTMDLVHQGLDQLFGPAPDAQSQQPQSTLDVAA